MKDLQKLSNKEIHAILQTDSTKDKPSQFISWSKVTGGYQNLTSGIRGKVLTD